MQTQTAGQIHNANIGINDRNRMAVADILNRVLSDQHVLYIKLRKYHWNVTGRLFYSLHQLLEVQYTALEAAIDETAERIRSIGAPAMGTMKEFLECTSLEEQPGDYPDEQGIISNLVNDHEKIIRNLREFVDATAEEYHDMGTSDFLTAQMEAHEKMAWMLRAFLEDKQQ